MNSAVIRTILLLCTSNIFMTFAWYGHLQDQQQAPWLIAVLTSWGIAFFEFIFQVPANRIGHKVLSVSQLKILQEVITLLVLLPFLVLFMHEPIKLNYLWAGLCIMGAVYFIFRQPAQSTAAKDSE